MRFCLSFLLPFLTTAVAWSQSDILSNSFEASYRKTNSTINYKYDSSRQIHDYSNNWDFDKDGKLDQLYFVGTGGAHLYFFLRIILSTDNMVRDFSFIQSDFPALPSDDELSKPSFNPSIGWTKFAVFDYDQDSGKDIFIKLDESSFDIEKKVLKKRGVKTNLVMITFEKGKAIFHDFLRKKQ